MDMTNIRTTPVIHSHTTLTEARKGPIPSPGKMGPTVIKKGQPIEPIGSRRDSSSLGIR